MTDKVGTLKKFGVKVEIMDILKRLKNFQALSLRTRSKPGAGALPKRRTAHSSSAEFSLSTCNAILMLLSDSVPLLLTNSPMLFLFSAKLH